VKKSAGGIFKKKELALPYSLPIIGPPYGKNFMA
jgi:hypothetical protein